MTERGLAEQQAYASGVEDERKRLAGRLLNLKIDLETGKTKRHAVRVIEEILREHR